jgi:peptide/nickel transport system substrate-binding protein
MKQKNSFQRWGMGFSLVLILSMILSACGNSATQTEVPTSTPTATSVPLKTLTVCVANEPSSLYIYGNSSQSMWSILEGVYDGPIDTVNYQPSPVILTEIPTQENGGITIQAATVTAGDLVANSEGDVVALAKGVKVFPAGCTSNECVTEWDGASDLQVSQMVVKFKLLADLKWSDGQPLTADDSVYSYQVAADAATQASKVSVKKTQSYQALDGQTVEWVGLPGYLTLNPSSYFWIPLPKHQLSQYTAEQLITANETTRNPMGWGPYMITEWKSGDSITLVKNPNYFRASEGLPYYDRVVFKFLGNIPVTDLTPVVNGECDIIDSSVSMGDQWNTIRSLVLDGKAKDYFGEGPEWEGLNFGINPSSYDEVFNPYLDRANFFGDVRTRQAVASCINRQQIIKMYVFSLGTLPDSYLTPTHPFYVKNLATYPYDVEKGKQLLDEVGWKDTDNDPATPRVARGIDTVLNDTPFIINYVATDTELHSNIATMIKSNLQECGITMNINLLPADQVYAAGPNGVVFGRNYDLAELGWATGSQPSCFLYSTSEIPSAENDWLGTKFGGVNITGYSNTTYDAACEKQLTSGLDKAGLIAANTETMTILANDLPVLPLFYHIKAMISRPDLCGLALDVSSRSGLRNIESLYVSDSCPAD